MGSLITWPEEIPQGAWGVRHEPCGRSVAVAVLATGDDIDGGGKLYCAGCGERNGEGYGFVVVRRPSVADQFPVGLVDGGWSATPHALWEHGHKLDLTPNERVLIGAIWRHQSGGSRSFPSKEKLSAETGIKRATLTRTIVLLEKRGLLRITRGHRGGKQLSNAYDLTPLWEALTIAQAAPAAQGEPRSAAQSEPQQRLIVSREVEPAQEDQDREEPPYGGSAAARRDAHGDDNESPGLARVVNLERAA